MATMEDLYKGQHILITGSTGFVGKVLVEKILRSLPGVEKLYLLIRPKKDVHPFDRLQKELFDSKVMDRVKEKYGAEGFKSMCKNKIVAVEGSLTEDNLGMTESTYSMLVKNCTMILHLAATIDFNEKLNMSTRLNVLGSMQVLALARKCHQRGNFDSFVHMSTCYVNYRLNGDQPVDEMLYPLGFDAEVMTKNILNYEEDDLVKDTPAILKKYGFPNTYTLTKSMSEHLLNSYRGSVPLTIVRPAIIGSALQEPFPGWVDTLSASGALFLTAGFGIVQEVHANPNCLADIIPVDYVVKGTLLAGAKVARETRQDAVANPEGRVAPAVERPFGSAALPLTAGNLQKAEIQIPGVQAIDVETRSTSTAVSMTDRTQRPMQVYQFCTSGSDNPVTWGMVVRFVRAYWEVNPPKKQVKPCKVVLVRNRAEYESRFHLKRTVPAALFYAQSRLPFPTARPEAVKNADRLKKATERAYMLVNQFRDFTNFSWSYMSTRNSSLLEGLGAAEEADWNMDLHDISWHKYLKSYCYGLMHYVIKEEGHELPDDYAVSGARQFARSHL
eukprot:TRINITY_DN30320_c0_g1_i1.p1 TRINITY_DN30320_c0_g1~~TRINITY_DN30320_c0_g1_i1.p1  ORF type:complete len:558 (+),score=168.63 TRINITY_DN30320_c0_g1_i1:58-1731(+)